MSAKTIGKKAAAAAAKKAAAAKLLRRGATTAVAAVVKPQAKTIASKHITDRYASYGHGKDEATTRTVETRLLVEKHIATGTATLGSVISNFGSGEAIRRMGRMAMRGNLAIAGWKPSVLDRKLGDKQDGTEKIRLATFAEKNGKSTVKIVGDVKHVSARL